MARTDGLISRDNQDEIEVATRSNDSQNTNSEAGSSQDERFAELEETYAAAQEEAVAAQEGLSSGDVTEEDLRKAYRKEADAKASLETAKARQLK